MKAIDRKVLRDLKEMRGQALAIFFVIFSAVAAFITFQSTMDSLERTLRRYYADAAFADVFASAKRAPQRLEASLRALPGVNQVYTRVQAPVNLEVAGFEEPISGLIISVPAASAPPLNKLVVQEGRSVRPFAETEVVLNEIFAEAHGLRPGSRLVGILNGRRKTLDVVGVGVSPEHLIQLQPGSMFPDPARYGVVWMSRDALAAAYDLEGAFNSAALSLAPGADALRVLAGVDDVLKPYGAQGAILRKDQLSHFYITEEFGQLRVNATILPGILLAVAAFLLHMTVSRLIATQREQIAVLKAFGYADAAIGLHYAKLVLLIAAAATLAGGLAGMWFGRSMSELYLTYYRFPYLDFAVRPAVVLSAAGLTTLAALAGVAQAVRRAVHLPPAAAMRPAAPPTYRPTWIERVGLGRRLDQPTRMIARHIERQPVKALLTVVGVAFSVAILIMGLFFNDSFNYIIAVQYGFAQREDLTVTFTEPTSTAALYEIAALPGVLHAEPFRNVPVRLRAGVRRRDTAIEGIPQDAFLRRILNADLQPTPPPPEGLMLSAHLAEQLGVGPGDALDVEILEGSRRRRRVPVVSLSEQFLGSSAVMALEAATRLTGDGQSLSGVLLSIHPDYERRLVAELRRRPRVAGIVSQERAIAAFSQSSAQTMLTFTFFLTLFSAVIAFGVIYNSMRISLAERTRELASLRVLGFTRGEIAYVLLGELGALTLLAIPVGFALGAGLAAMLVEALQTDLYRLPVVLEPPTFALAACVVLACSALSGLVMRRRLNALDLVEVLKTRE